MLLSTIDCCQWTMLLRSRRTNSQAKITETQIEVISSSLTTTSTAVLVNSFPALPTIRDNARMTYISLASIEPAAQKRVARSTSDSGVVQKHISWMRLRSKTMFAECQFVFRNANLILVRAAPLCGLDNGGSGKKP